MRPRLALAGSAMLLALAGISCDWPLFPEYKSRLASVGNVLAPDTVHAGKTFVVTIMTGGPDACWQKGDDEVGYWFGGILIVPRDRMPTQPRTCATVVSSFRHDVPLRIATRGRTKLFIRHYLRSVANEDSSGMIVRDLVVQ